MTAFDVIATTTRDGLAVNTVEFEVPGAPPATAYRLGDVPGRMQPLAIVLHDERGDKATLLHEAERLAAHGFVCLCIDSPESRSATARRDPLAAFEAMLDVGRTGLAAARTEPEIHENAVAVLGRELGAEVGARIAAVHEGVRVGVAIGPLPRRSGFVERSPHPLAEGIRRFRPADEVAAMVRSLGAHDLVPQLEARAETNWLVQIADDDDRLGPDDRRALLLDVPPAVRLRRYPVVADLRGDRAHRERIDFITTLC